MGAFALRLRDSDFEPKNMTETIQLIFMTEAIQLIFVFVSFTK